MERPRCNLCQTNSFKIFRDTVTSWEHPGSFRLVKCSNCELIFLNPRPSPSEIGKYYPASSYWGSTERDLTALFTDREQSYDFLYQKIFRHLSQGKILDIGAGTGLFLSKFKELGWQVEGVELSKDAVIFGKKILGVKMRAGDFLDLKFTQKNFDVVTLNNSLEHLYDPSATLEKVSRVMKANGLVVITVPNIDSYGSRFFKNNWYALQPPRHLYHFTPQTLTSLVEKAGFTVISIDHGYRVHNFAALFESFRIMLSPRFKRIPSQTSINSAVIITKPSIKNEVGKIVFKVLATLVAFLGQVTSRGETITLLAIKKVQ